MVLGTGGLPMHYAAIREILETKIAGFEETAGKLKG
jgi:hypothetical protein